MSHSVEARTEGHVGFITFGNPPHNFATVGLLQSIAGELEAMDNNPSIRAIVLSSEGKVFCAGADLVSPNGFGASGSDPLREFYDQVLRLFRTRKPIVAVIQGAAIGAGLGLAVAADFRVASPEARFSANFVKLGFHPGFGLTHTLPRVVGQQKAAEMFLTASRYKAEEVAGWGLVDHLVPADSLFDTATQFANAIAENAPLGLLATRETLRGSLADDVERVLLREHAEQLKLQNTEDFAEGVRAVGERRPGQFKGR